MLSHQAITGKSGPQRPSRRTSHFYRNLRHSGYLTKKLGNTSFFRSRALPKSRPMQL